MIKKFKQFISWTLSIILALFILSAIKDCLLKIAIETSSPGIIGAKVQMGSFSLGLLTHKVHIRNLRVYNPPDFPDRIFLVMPEVLVDIDMFELIQGQLHFPVVVFNMDKMIIFKNKDGKININSLKIIQQQQAANKGKPVKLPVFKIDLLELSIGQVILEDHTHAPPVLVEAYDVAIKNDRVRNIDGLPKLIAAVSFEALKPTAIRGAGLFAAETLLGVAFLPAAVVGVSIAQDDAKADLKSPFSKTYQESLKLVQDLGVVKKADLQKGQIAGKVYGSDITIDIQDTGWNSSHIKISARRFFLARFEIANGLLYQLTERLK